MTRGFKGFNNDCKLGLDMKIYENMKEVPVDMSVIVKPYHMSTP